MIKILIADDHEIVRSGLRGILETRPQWCVVGEAGDGREAVRRAIQTNPDVAILDYSMPQLNGIEAAKEIRSQLPRAETLIFTMHYNETLIHDLIEAGIRGYLLKSDARRHLVGAVESLAVHKPFFTRAISEEMCELTKRRQIKCGSTLTNRERTVVRLIAEGHSNKGIAYMLTISAKTVESHRAAIMRKLALSSSASLVRYAVRNGIIEA